MNASPTISLIFVNYRSAQYLKAALESLFSFERGTAIFEIIVINNDPSESALLQALKQTFPFLLIENSKNSGFGRGSNLGAKQARGKILGFINPDVLWMGTYLQKIADFFEKNGPTGVLGMMLLDTKKKRESWSAGKEPSLTTLFFNNFFSLHQACQSDQKTFSPDWVSAGALFIRKELFAKIGGFDERFFLYFEDVDLCKEVRRRGFSVVCHAEFPLIHLGGKSQESPHLQKKYFSLSQREYFRKHRPRWEATMLEFMQFLFCRR